MLGMTILQGDKEKIMICKERPGYVVVIKNSKI